MVIIVVDDVGDDWVLLTFLEDDNVDVDDVILLRPARFAAAVEWWFVAAAVELPPLTVRRIPPDILFKGCCDDDDGFECCGLCWCELVVVVDAGIIVDPFEF